MATRITAANIQPGSITADRLVGDLSAISGGPKVTNIQIADESYTVIDDTAISTSGGRLRITGSGFQTGCSVIIGTVTASSTGFVNSNFLNVQVSALSAGTYTVYVVNPDGGTAIRINGLTASGTPLWITGSSLAEQNDGAAFSIQLSATSDSGVTYAVAAGSSLPPGVTLSSSGLLSGSVTGITEPTVYSFTIEATDAENQESPRSFTITVTVGDEYFSNTVLLLNADNNTFITDASTNNFTITPAGDTRPSAFSPYNTGWSNYFDGTDEYLAVQDDASLDFGAGDFTIEFWENRLFAKNDVAPLQRRINNSGTSDRIWAVAYESNGALNSYFDNGAGTVYLNLASGTARYNQWVHRAYCRSGNTVYAFENGVLIASGALTQTLPAGSAALSIGRMQSGYDFPGYLSNVRLVKGTAVYTSNFTPPTAPLTAISGTQLLTCQSNRLRDASTNNFTLTRNGDVKVTAFAPFTNTDTVTGSGYFDGTGDYLTVNNFNGSLGAGNYTIEFWFNTNDTNNFEFFGPTVGLAGPAIIGSSTTTLAVQYQYGSGTGFSWTTGNVFDNNWHHLALVRNGTTVTLYVDGISRASGTNSPVTDYSGYTTNWTLGYGNQGAGRIYLGYMSDFRVVAGTAVYTENFSNNLPTSPLPAVSGTQLLTLQNRIGYNNSQPIDESGIRNVITRVGNASAGTFSPHVPTGWSGYFDGTGDYLTLSDNTAFTLTSDFTIECFFFTPVLPTSINVIAAKWAGSAQEFIFDYGVRSGSNARTVRFFWGPHSLSVPFLTSPNDAFNVGEWVHAAIVRSGSTITMYINGVSVVSGNNGTAASDFSQPLYIGAYGAGPEDYLNGYISNFRIVKGTAIDFAATGVPTSPLEPIANTSLLTLRGPSFTDDGANRFAITRNGDTRITAFSPFAPHTRAPDSHSVYFDGTGDYLTTPSNVAFAMGTGNITAECWFYSTSSAQHNWLFDFRTSGSESTTRIYAYIDSGTLKIGFGALDDQSSGTTILNAWNHVAVVRSGSGSNNVAVFLNGTRTNQFTQTTDFSTNTLIHIGRRYILLSTDYMVGYISNVRAIKGTAVYDPASTTITVPTSPLTAIANTSLLTCQSPTVVDNSDNEFALTVNGNSQPTQFNPFGETVATGVEYAPASHGGSVYFDGTGDYLSSGTSTAYTLGTGDFTIEAWLYNFGFAGSQYGRGWCTLYQAGGYNTTRLMLRLWNGTDNMNMWLYLNPSVYFGGSGTNSTALITPYSWTHAAFVRQSGTFKLYINGTLDTTISGVTIGLNFDTVEIGRNQDGSVPDWNGYISNHRIVKGTAVYTSAFVPPAAPATPIAGTTLLVNGTNAAIQDRTGRTVLETVGNARVINGVRKYGSGAIYFDGTGDRLTLKNNDLFKLGSGMFTVEVWIYPTNNSGYQVLIGQQNYYDTTGWGIWRDTSTGWGFWGPGGATKIGNTSIDINTWTHIAAVRNSSGTITFYKNGTSVGSASLATFTDSSAVMTIGAAINGTTWNAEYPYSGYIDDLRITKGVARYTANFTAPTKAHSTK